MPSKRLTSRAALAPVPQTFIIPDIDDAYLDDIFTFVPQDPASQLSQFTMFPRLGPSSLLAALLYWSLASAYTVLDNQCWPEPVFRTITLQSHTASTSARTLEIVNPVNTQFISPVSFHLPWPWTYPPLCTSPFLVSSPGFASTQVQPSDLVAASRLSPLLIWLRILLLFQPLHPLLPWRPTRPTNSVDYGSPPASPTKAPGPSHCTI